MSELETEIRELQCEAQDVSHGIWDSLGSLADGVGDGTIGSAEAGLVLAELSGDLAEAAAEPGEE